MAVTSLEIRSRHAYQEGRMFGPAGAYERVDGVLRFAVDPRHPANGAITDLDKAPRDADGRVGFEADFCLLQPVAPHPGAGKLLFDVLNRGSKLAHRQLNRAPQDLAPTDEIDPGDGWLFDNGWSVAWCGWQWDLPRGQVPGVMGIDVPHAQLGGKPVEGPVRVELSVARSTRSVWLCDTLGQVHFRPYPAADVDQPDALMTVQDRPCGPADVIPRDRWRFAKEVEGQPRSDPNRVWLAGGFEPGRTYSVVYRTNLSPVVGAGLLAIRDTVSFLRHGSPAEGNPAAGRVGATFAFGASQSGRVLRTFLWHGLNRDEAGRQVLDGVHIHIAGGRRGEFNQRFGQPSVQGAVGIGHLPPFPFDPVGGTPGLLDEQRRLGCLPRIVATNTAVEYWRGDAALTHIDADRGVDLELPENVRSYLFAGAQHGSGALPLTTTSPLRPGIESQHPLNVLDYRPLTRAALRNLERWVMAGEEPPPSMLPRLSDGAATKREAALDALPALPGGSPPAEDEHPAMPRILALGPDAASGVCEWPARIVGWLPAFVSNADGDGNELAGIRLPDVSVPVGTHTGWSARHASAGREGAALALLGASVPFAATRSERGRTDDARPSIEERYSSRDDYAARVREAAEALAAARYLLAEDINLAVEAAMQRYDAFSSHVAQ